MAAIDKKDTIYVDIDDEITSIIEKVRGSDGKVVALVLPKRATVLQSVVNMKLLKRTSENVKKHLVLVTSEASLLPLAGMVGLHVASTPTSKPIIPPAPVGPSDEPEDIDEPLAIADNSSDALNEEDAFDSTAAAKTPIGELAGAAASSKITDSDIDEDITMDDESSDASGTAVPLTKKSKNSKKLKVPNFDSFRKKLLLGMAVLTILIVGYIVAFVVLPKATVTIHTDTTTITTNINLNLDSNAKSLDTANKTVPAIAQTTSKSYSQQVSSTGQQNNGTKANGSVVFYNCDKPDRLTAQNETIPSGTGISANGNTYITQSAANVPPSSFKSDGTCRKDNASASIPIVALKGGQAYNTDATSFTTSFANPVDGTNSFSGTGSANGGSDNITKIVAQADIDSATAKLKAEDTTAIKTGLQATLQGKSVLPIVTTFLAGDPQTTTSANVGDAADTVTVTQVVNYTMLGVKQTDLTTLVDANVTSQIDKGKQVILDDGVSKATFTEQNPATTSTAVVALSTKSVAGPEIDTTSLPKQLTGKKTGDIQSLLKQTPGVTDVTVTYSPFWVSSAPSNAKKITVQLDKANTGNQ